MFTRIALVLTAVLLSSTVALSSLETAPVEANPLHSLTVEANCDSVSHQVTAIVSQVDSPRNLVVIGQVRIAGVWHDAGSPITITVPVGSTSVSGTATFPLPANADAYRVRLVSTTLDNPGEISVSNTVECVHPTATPTVVPPTATSAPTNTPVPPTTTPTSTPTSPTSVPSATPTQTPPPPPTQTSAATPTPVTPTATAPSGGQAPTAVIAQAAPVHTVSYEYLCVTSDSETSNGTLHHIDVIRTSDANAYLAAHPNASRMPKSGCGPTDTLVGPPTLAPIATLTPTPMAVSTVTSTPTVVPATETPVPTVVETPQPTATPSPAPCVDCAPPSIDLPVQLPDTGDPNTLMYCNDPNSDPAWRATVCP